MAFDSSSDQADDDQQAASGTQAAGQAGQSTQLSGGGGGFAGSTGAAPTGGASAPGTMNQTPSSSGSWTNLNSYLNANSDQSPGLGQAIASTVGNQAQQAQSDLGSVTQGFQSQAPYQALNNTTSSQVDQAFANPSQYATSQGTTAPDTTTPENYLNNNWGLTSQNQDITQYAPTTGPTWAGVTGEYNTAGANLQDTQSESGRDVLLQNQYGQGSNNYNPGEQNFDQLLLQQNPSNQTALNNVYNQYAPGVAASSATSAAGGVPTDLYNAQQNAAQYATNENNLATGYQTQAIGDLNNQISGLGSNVNSELSTDQAGYPAQYQSLVSALNNDSTTQAQDQSLGYDPTQPGYGVSASSYLTPGANPYTGSQGANYAASNNDWQNFSGLNALVSGMSNNGTQQANLANVGLTGTQAQQALAPAASPYSFSAGNYGAAVAAAKSDYTQQLNALENSTLNLGDPNALANRDAAIDALMKKYGNPDGVYSYANGGIGTVENPSSTGTGGPMQHGAG